MAIVINTYNSEILVFQFIAFKTLHLSLDPVPIPAAYLGISQ